MVIIVICEKRKKRKRLLFLRYAITSCNWLRRYMLYNKLRKIGEISDTWGLRAKRALSGTVQSNVQIMALFRAFFYLHPRESARAKNFT